MAQLVEISKQPAKDEYGRPQCFCVVCQAEFWSETEYHRMGLCHHCARRAGAAFLHKHAGECDDLRLDPSGEFAEPASRRKSKKAVIPQSLRWTVFERDGFACLHCGTRSMLRADHVQPESAGGAMTIDNLQTLCHSCNSRKGARVA